MTYKCDIQYVSIPYFMHEMYGNPRIKKRMCIFLFIYIILILYNNNIHIYIELNRKIFKNFKNKLQLSK